MPLIGILWVMQVGLFAGAMVFGWRDAPDAHGPGRVWWPIRIGVSASLILSAWLIWNLQQREIAAYARTALWGMAFSFIGDLFMANLIPVPSRFIAGMIAFGIGHVFYIEAYHAAAIPNDVALLQPALYAIASVYALAIAWAWWRMARSPHAKVALRLGAAAYGALIAAMSTTAILLALGAGGGWWLAAAGSILFVVSDGLIALTEIAHEEIRGSRDAIWITYLAGQMGIIYAPWVVALLHSPS